MGSKTGIREWGHKSCLTTSPVQAHRRKAKQTGVFTNSEVNNAVLATLVWDGRSETGNPRGHQGIFSFIERSDTPAFDGWWHNLLSKASLSLLQWTCGWKPFHDSQSKITAHETFSFLSWKCQKTTSRLWPFFTSWRTQGVQLGP